MKQKRRKPRIITNNKSYPIQDSVFYKLSNKKRLASILGSTPLELKSLRGDDNYRCFSQAKNDKKRPIQEPLLKLDRIHSRVASLLCRIETSETLHSGKKGSSNISNAKAHLGLNKKVITVDIKNFFPSTTRKHVFDFFFNTMQCSPDIADLLSKVLTYNNHVPTGSRVSMALAYFANKKMFDEMEIAADECGARMTIYVDDLTFSGDKLHRSFTKKIEVIAKTYGHKIHPSKTRFYNANEVKLITGAAVKKNAITPRNKHLKLLQCELSEWLDSPVKDKKLTNRVLGRMSFMASISPRYKDKCRTFRKHAFNKKTIKK